MMILNNPQIQQLQRTQSRTRNQFELPKSSSGSKNARAKSSFGYQRTKAFDKQSDSEQEHPEYSEPTYLAQNLSQHRSINDSNCRIPQKARPPFHPGRSQTIRLQSAGLAPSNNITASRERENVRRNYSNKVKGLNLKALQFYDSDKNRFWDNDLNSFRKLESGRYGKETTETARLRRCQTFCFRRQDELIPVQDFLLKKSKETNNSTWLKDINAQLRQTLNPNFLVSETNTIYDLVTNLYEQHEKLVKLYFCKQNVEEISETEHSQAPEPLQKNTDYFFMNPMFSTIDFNMSAPSSNNVSFAGLEHPINTSRPKNPLVRMDEIIQLLVILTEENDLLIQKMETKELWSEENSPARKKHSIKEEESHRIARLSEQTESVAEQNNWIVKRLDQIEFQIGAIQQKQDMMTPLPNLEELEQEHEIKVKTPEQEAKEIENGNFDEMYYTCIMEDEIQDQKLLNATLKEKINLIETSAQKKIEILEYNIQKLREENQYLREEMKKNEETLHLQMKTKDEKIEKLQDELLSVRRMSTTLSEEDFEEEYRVDKMKKQIEEDILAFSQKMALKQREIAQIEEKLSFSHIQRIPKSLKHQGLRKPTRFKSISPFERQSHTTRCSETDRLGYKFELESGKMSKNQSKEISKPGNCTSRD